MVLPIRIIIGLFQLIFLKKNTKTKYCNDILIGCLIVIVCFIVNLWDISNLYHSIRSQSTLKLYVIFNVLEVLDKLFSSFGLDLLDAFLSQPISNSKSNSNLNSIFQFILAGIYIRNSTQRLI